MTTAVDGLISGINTTQMISQLMQLEAAPQTALKGKVSNQNKLVSAYQAINTKFSNLQTAANTLTLADTWKATKATSSSTAVAATASAGASTGNVTFDVKALSRAEVSTAAVASSGAITTGGGLDISFGGGDPIHVDVTTDDAQGVADAINAAGLDVKAAVLTTDQGTVLQLTGTKTGTANGFTVAGLQATVTEVTAAADASIQVGTLGAGGYTVSSSTNTFTNLIAGVTLTATKVEDGVTVSVVSDTASIAEKVTAMVDAANAAITEIKNYTGYDAASKKSGALSGDFQVSQLGQKILSKIAAGEETYGSYKQLGIELDRNGKITFDKEKFLAALAADPVNVQAALQGETGLAKGLESIADAATNSTTGTITTAISGANRYIETLNDQIADFDVRLELRRKTLTRQFTNLEVALGKLRNQSNWLAGQLSSLPTTSSGE